MKKSIQFFISFCFLFLSARVNAQTKTGADYFAGKWNVLVKGLPNGDTHMFFVLEKKDTTLTGIVQDSTGLQISKIDKADIGATSTTIYFAAEGYDVNLLMNKKDEDHITGSLMSMFDAEGERVKVTK